LVGRSFDATTKSTSILSPSLYSSLTCVPDLNADLEWVCVLPSSKGNITKWGVTRQ
jgi:hypothetical protein